MTGSVRTDMAGGHLTVTLARPETSNALSADMVETLIETFADPGDCRSCVITAEGRNFCAGFDLSDLDDLSDGDLLLRLVRIETLLQAVHHAPFPVMALAQGHVVGAGADLFAACWRRVAAPDARLRMPGWNFGIALGTGRLARLVGEGNARDMLIDTRGVNAEEALGLGLASAIVPLEDWPENARAFRERSVKLEAGAVADMLGITVHDSRVRDMAELVRTASTPGLKARISAYRDRVARERSGRRPG